MPEKADFKPGDIVWAKCGYNFWPAEMVDFDKLEMKIQEEFDEDDKPLYVVKFFDEEGYEFLYDGKTLHPYNCKKKEEFIKKGVSKSREEEKAGIKNGWFSKFPKDVILCENLTHGDVKILEKDPYLERKKEKTKVDFKTNSRAPVKSPQKTDEVKPTQSTPVTQNQSAITEKNIETETPVRPITHPRFKPGGEKHQIRILDQPAPSIPFDLQKEEENKSSIAQFKCPFCDFTTSRINVLILHIKSPACKSYSDNSKKISLVSTVTKTPKKSSRNKVKIMFRSGNVSLGLRNCIKFTKF